MSSNFKAQNRIEPHFATDAPVESISFLHKRDPLPAGTSLRIVTFALAGLCVAVQLTRAASNGEGAAELLGAALGALLLVMLPVWLYGLWDGDLKQRRKFQIAAATAAVLLAVQLAGFMSKRGLFQEWLQTTPLSREQLKERALVCQARGDYACADNMWTRYLEVGSEDHGARATLGMIKTQRGDDPGAIREFERALSSGTGGYDLFAYYARSLSRVGRTSEAISWYHGALTAVPSLVDVRRELSHLLLAQGRHFEALAVLEAFDAKRELNGQPAYFAADRVAVQDAIRTNKSETTPPGEFRLAAVGGHFFVPVALGWARSTPFMVDTGATVVSVSSKALNESGVQYRVVDGNAQVTVADGRKVPARLLLLERLQVGPYLLRDVKAVSCDTCAALLGASAISKFDLKSSKEHGTEFLSFVPRI